MNDTPNNYPAPMRRLKIWQENINKSSTAHYYLINQDLHRTWDVILIQEPYLDAFKNTKANSYWRVIYPTDHLISDTRTRSVILVNSNLDTNNWTQLTLKNTGDITAIQLTGQFGRATIFNIYNDCDHSNSLHLLNDYVIENRLKLQHHANDYVIWGGDFNRHHPFWDEERNSQLFTNKALDDAAVLLEHITEHDMVMLLPKNIPTLRSMVTKNWTRPDNIFGSSNVEELLVSCETQPGDPNPGTDHVPIRTIVDLPLVKKESPPSFNFRMTEWDDFRDNLRERLQYIPPPQVLIDEAQFQKAVQDLTETLQQSIQSVVPKQRPSPHMRRWWTSDLRRMKRERNKLSETAFRYRALPDHPSHQELKTATNRFSEAVKQAKIDHWTDFLEEATEREVWIANRYISNPVSDGGKTRVPTLHVVDDNGANVEATTNEEKSRHLANAFFPKKPATSSVPRNHQYPDPVPFQSTITPTQIHRNIAKLKPYKMHGPDEIPNVVLMKTEDIIAEYLLQIFRAVFTLETYSNQWREWTTVVLKKPGKPKYDIPKAYRPIALLNTVGKLLTAIVAEDLTYMCEKYSMLPNTHFGGRPGRSTTDALHYVVNRIHHAWRNNKVAVIVYLDIEGAFPNAVTERLLHNMRKRGVPEAYVKFVERMLANRRTRLRFDDYLSEWFDIDNGIGQGDPLSMILYLFYNGDILSICKMKYEDAVAFVDDAMIYVEAKSLLKCMLLANKMMT